MAVTPEPQYAATGHAVARRRAPRSVARSSSSGRKRPSVVGVPGERGVDRAGDVAGHRVDRLVLAAEPLGGADVEQHAVGGPGPRASPASTTGSWPGVPSQSPGSGDDGLGRDGRPGGGPGGEPAVEDQHVVVAVVAEQPPQPGRRGARPVVVHDDASSRARCRHGAWRPRTARGRGAGAARRGPGGAARSSSTSRYAAPGTWPASYRSRPVGPGQRQPGVDERRRRAVEVGRRRPAARAGSRESIRTRRAAARATGLRRAPGPR